MIAMSFSLNLERIPTIWSVRFRPLRSWLFRLLPWNSERSYIPTVSYLLYYEGKLHDEEQTKNHLVLYLLCIFSHILFSKILFTKCLQLWWNLSFHYFLFRIWSRFLVIHFLFGRFTGVFLKDNRSMSWSPNLEQFWVF